MKKNNTGLLLGILIALLMFFYAVPYFSFNIGKNAYERNDYLKAFSTLAFSYKMHKDNENYRYYYALTLIKLKPALKVQKDLFELSQSKIDDSAKRIAAEKINDWRLNVNYNAGNNYIYNAPSERGIVRWDENKFPLKVFLKNLDSVPDYYKTEINSAFAQWQRRHVPRLASYRFPSVTISFRQN